MANKLKAEFNELKQKLSGSGSGSGSGGSESHHHLFGHSKESSDTHGSTTQSSTGEATGGTYGSRGQGTTGGTGIRSDDTYGSDQPTTTGTGYGSQAGADTLGAGTTRSGQVYGSNEAGRGSTQSGQSYGGSRVSDEGVFGSTTGSRQADILSGDTSQSQYGQGTGDTSFGTTGGRTTSGSDFPSSGLGQTTRSGGLSGGLTGQSAGERLDDPSTGPTGAYGSQYDEISDVRQSGGFDSDLNTAGRRPEQSGLGTRSSDLGESGGQYGLSGEGIQSGGRDEGFQRKQDDQGPGKSLYESAREFVGK
ncbi:hypothetical protein V1514DRAFT_32777 [Lipomyces japonicus]|uniref:uncharacterized protein n=1 Tax=Lipomyces japonicus TaxID=56871 RepID=UPI0034CF61F2